jgi:Fe-S cluster assembly scaffold protein SufB
MVDGLNDDQIEFLFTYFFTESKEKREKMWNEMQKKYELVLQELEQVADRLQKLNLQFSELLAAREDVEEFGKKYR